MDGVACTFCSTIFFPKEKGFNAKYCSGRCRNKSRKARMPAETKRLGRQRRHQRVKNDPARLIQHRASGSASARKARTWLARYKLERGCVDCGFNKHFAALQLDHTGIKSVEISQARSSIERLKAEIENGQCVVRCANCHAVKTWNTKQRKGG